MKRISGFFIALVCALNLHAQDSTTDSTKLAKYRRSSLYTVLIQHPDKEFGKEIAEVFMSMPAPDKFDNHDLAPELKMFESGTEGKTKKQDADGLNRQDIDLFIEQNHVARGLVAKWFDRDEETSAFDMNLISYRGNYDASLSDVSLAEMSARGKALLSDAGEELIGNTFVLVNDITYIKKEEQTKKAGGLLRIAGAVGGAFVSGVDDLANTAATVTEQFGGFSVRITSYLYQLDWTEEVAATFYQDYWVDGNNPDETRREAFDQESLFKLKYIGTHSSNAGNVAVKGFSRKTDETMIRKVCTRALDRSIVELQREYDEFKVNVPIYSIDEAGNVYVQIGLKEGINERSQFEVLEQIETEDGHTEYKKIGMIAPVKGQIWDNRFMAAEEAKELAESGVKNADKDAEGGDVNLTATQFKKVSGGELYPGLLIREVTIKTQK